MSEPITALLEELLVEVRGLRAEVAQLRDDPRRRPRPKKPTTVEVSETDRAAARAAARRAGLVVREKA